MWKIRTYSEHVLFAQQTSLCAILLISGLVWAEDTPNPPLNEWVSGDLALGLYTGYAEDDRDVEMDQFLRLNVDPPKHERLHVRSTLWFSEDLEGNESPTSPFRGLNDTSDTWVTTRVLSLYMEYEDEKDDARVRVGRQRIRDGVAYNRIDGVYLSTKHGDARFYGFFGARASIYENSHEDVSTGVGGSWLVLPETRASLDIFYGDDERRRFSGMAEDDLQSTLTSLSLYHLLATQHHLFGRATWHESDLDEFRLTAQGVVADEDLFYTLSYRKRVSTLAERPTDFPQFYHIVGELNGYEDVQGVFGVPITDRIELGLEAQIHDAENSALSTANRDYTRLGFSVDISEVATHYDVQVILELWDAAQGESEKTISGEVSREWEDTRIAVGLDYDRFQDRIRQYDPLDQDDFFVESRDDIYSAYLKVKHKLDESQTVRVRASVEEDDTDDAPIWRLRAVYVLDF